MATGDLTGRTCTAAVWRSRRFSSSSKRRISTERTSNSRACLARSLSILSHTIKKMPASTGIMPWLKKKNGRIIAIIFGISTLHTRRACWPSTICSQYPSDTRFKTVETASESNCSSPSLLYAIILCRYDELGGRLARLPTTLAGSRSRRFRDSRSSCQRPKTVRRAKGADGQAPSADGTAKGGEQGEGGKAKGGDGAAEEREQGGGKAKGERGKAKGGDGTADGTVNGGEQGEGGKAKGGDGTADGLAKEGKG